MALTKISGSVIKDSVSLSGNVSIGGTLTYQDVTNVDALGIGTFRTGIKVLAGQVDIGSNIKLGNAGVITATSFVGSGANLTGLNSDLVSDTSPQLGGDLASNSNDILMAANDRIVFGSDALRVKHTGSHADIENTTGNITIKNDSSSSTEQILIQAKGGEDSIKAIANGAVELYHNNSKRLESTSQGVDLGFVDGNIRFMAANGSSNIYVNTDDSELKMWDNAKILMGASEDLQIFHDGSDSFIKDTGTGALKVCSNIFRVNNAANSEAMIKAEENAGVTLSYDANTKFETTSSGVTVTGGVTCDGVTLGDNEVIQLGNSSDLRIYHDSGANYIGSPNSQSVVIYTANTSRWMFQSDGNLRPIASNSYDIGSASFRVRNIYTNDLHLSNEGHSNEVDGTWGNYTIQEGESDLYLINNRNGKKYKFNLTEVS
mgnify:CR=1 FL=1